jgi:hypothetical protein
MTSRLPNPFNITKAVDFSDEEIRDYWVDLPGGPGFHEMAKPASPMPMLILGGKGSGKTHLMRYFSYPLQKLRHSQDIAAGLVAEGYIGVYMRCGGLNAARFSGKGQEVEKWNSVFCYYMDLWLAQLTIDTVRDAFSVKGLHHIDALLAEGISKLVDMPITWAAPSLAGVLDTLRSWQRELDTAVNNAAITRTLAVTIRTSPGRLVFGIPRIITSLIPELKGSQFLYLIDELENLTAEQQKYVNTLIREKEPPCSFKIGARLYGIKTYETYSAGETNKEGSEYERLFLDEHLRQNPNYDAFARELCARRLIESGYFAAEGSAVQRLTLQLPSFFESQLKGPFARDESRLLLANQTPKPKPYFLALRKKLLAGLSAGKTLGITSSADVDYVIEKLTVLEYPVLEKAALHQFFKAWSNGRNLRVASDAIARECAEAVASGKPQGALRSTLGHFQGDLLAQLYADYDQRPLYIGIDTFIKMSRGLPRNLLVILKHVFQWASFNGETPFRGEPITRAAQQKGVLEAAQWFFRDAEVLGEEGANVQNALRRLAELFRDIRFADKPAECSLSTFSTNLAGITSRSRALLDLSEKWSLLIRVRNGQKDRNTNRVDAKYQVNSMLAPLWDLPISRRGAVALNTDEVDSIFDPVHVDEFTKLKRRRIARMTAPQFDLEDVILTPEALPLFGNG